MRPLKLLAEINLSLFFFKMGSHRVEGMAQVVECLPSRYEALNMKPMKPPQKKKRKRGRKKRKKNNVLLCSPGWPQTSNPPASAS
jgi:hypothetical protein